MRSLNLYDTDYFLQDAVSKTVDGTLIWTINAVVIAIVGGIGLYFTVFNKNNENKHKGILGKIYNFVNFKYFLIDDLFRIGYLICALMVTLLSFNYITSWRFFIVLILGNVSLRITFELLLLFSELCLNVREINKKMKK